jgi:hypothetical protein
MSSFISYSVKLFRAIVSIAVLVTMTVIAGSYAGYGDVSGGLPLWKERQILVLTNACRMAPVQYRDAYVGNYAILDSSKYPPVSPLYFNINLGRSANAHALDMGDTCGVMQHNSCNGTSWDARVKAYYKTSSWIGENIANGNADPFATINQWIMDSRQGTNLPAADSSLCTVSAGRVSLCDGHRWNIMNKQYKEMGTGYAYGTNSALQYHYFWVQDFGGGSPAIANPIVGGTHFLRESGKTTFLANYWDPSLKAPTEASMYLEGQKYTMTLLMGSASRGTYQIVLARGSACRTYYFSFIDGSNKSWRYPEQGALTTAGEGGCTFEYEFPTSTRLSQKNGVIPGNANQIMSRASRCGVAIVVRKGMFFPQSTMLIDGKGRILKHETWRRPDALPAAGEEVSLNLPLQKPLPQGIYFLVHRISNTNCVGEKILLTK